MTRRKTRAAEWRESISLPAVKFVRTGVPEPVPGWKQMCKAVGLRPAASGSDKRKKYTWYSLKGRGRYWRVSGRKTFDVSCRYADFDRWANSQVAVHPIPINKAHLELLVRFTTYDA